MPPKKRTRQTADTPPPSKKIRSSGNGSDPADTEERRSESPQRIPTPSLTDYSDPALDEEDAEPEAETAEKPGLTDDGATDKSKRTYGGGYNALKSFNGQVYSGMAVGGSHTWNYDEGTWKETKVEPDLWKVDYPTTKRRARKAPKGSGAPVGTEYHWLIVAHQVNYPHTHAIRPS